MGAQLPACWPVGSKRLVQCQIVPWFDWTRLFGVGRRALLGGGLIPRKDIYLGGLLTSKFLFQISNYVTGFIHPPNDTFFMFDPQTGNFPFSATGYQLSFVLGMRKNVF
jgi:hypothetical protein